MGLIVIAIWEKSGQILMHIHTKMHTQKTKPKKTKPKSRREKKNGGEGK